MCMHGELSAQLVSSFVRYQHKIILHFIQLQYIHPFLHLHLQIQETKAKKNKENRDCTQHCGVL